MTAYKASTSGKAFLSSLLLLVFLALPSIGAAQRVALLIGNSEYSTSELRLRNPARDVAALGQALDHLGFDVIEAVDQSAGDMRSALTKFETAAKDAEMALFFFAGHGVQIGQQNHLIGTDFAGTNTAALRESAITMEEVRAAIVRAAPKIGVLILDACRDNPFAQNGDVLPGLAQVRGAAGLLIAYATDPGNVAFDGVGENSAFTSSLLDHIDTPGLDIRLMFGRVRQDVVLNTAGRQIPWVEESVLGEFELAPASETALLEEEALEMALWRSIMSSQNQEDYQDFLTEFPNGLFAEFARDRLTDLEQVPAGSTDNTQFAALSNEKTQAALVSLGFLSSGVADQDAVTRALSLYQQKLPGDEQLSEASLLQDATRSSMFLAATTLQQLRSDIVALRSVERTLTIAKDALQQIEEIAQTNDAALPVLRTARLDVEDIRRSRGIILRRLDQSRSYYDDLLARSLKFVPRDASTTLLVNPTQTRGIADAERILTENADLFLRHVSQAHDTSKGSYQWLADLVSQD